MFRSKNISVRRSGMSTDPATLHTYALTYIVLQPIEQILFLHTDLHFRHSGPRFFLSFLIDLGLGSNPFTFMNVSLSNRISWTFGNWQLTLNLALLILVLLTLGLRYLGIGTIANMVLIGVWAGGRPPIACLIMAVALALLFRPSAPA